MDIAGLAKKFGQAKSPVRISVSGLAQNQEDLEQGFSPARPARLNEGARLSHMLELDFVVRTDTGRVRDHNEDFLGYASPATSAQARTHGWLFVLADGVGG